jgi:hypothetical protein
MYRILLFSWLAASLLLFSSCKKDFQDLIQGRWERVNVENVNDPNVQEWVFENGEFNVYRRPQSNTSGMTVIDNGIYVLDSTPFKHTLKILNSNNELFNENWDIVELTNEKFIIKRSLTGGIILLEFVKL